MSVYLFIVISILGIVAVASASFQDPNKNFGAYGRLDKAGIIFNIILSISYLCLYFIDIIGLAAGTIFFINQVEGIMMIIFQFIVCIVPLICIVSIALSVKLRKIGKSRASFFVQFFPVIVFILNGLLLI